MPQRTMDEIRLYTANTLNLRKKEEMMNKYSHQRLKKDYTLLENENLDRIVAEGYVLNNGANAYKLLIWRSYTMSIRGKRL
jgi:hypothetical protein